VSEAGPGHLSEHAARIVRQALGQFCPPRLIECAAGLEVIGAIQHPANHVPLGQTKRVIPHGIEHSTVGLAFGLRMSGAGGTMT
jgi:hypothetical protein